MCEWGVWVWLRGDGERECAGRGISGRRLIEVRDRVGGKGSRRRGSVVQGVWGQSSPSCLERAGLSRGAGQRDAATFTFPYVFVPPPPPSGCSIFSSLSRLGGAAGCGCGVRCECACLSATATWDLSRHFCAAAPPGARPGGERRVASESPGRAPGGSAEHLWLGAGGGASKKKFTAACPWPRLALGEGRERPTRRNRCCVGMRAPREKPFKPGHPHPPKQLRPQFQPVS